MVCKLLNERGIRKYLFGLHLKWVFDHKSTFLICMELFNSKSSRRFVNFWFITVSWYILNVINYEWITPSNGILSLFLLCYFSCPTKRLSLHWFIYSFCCHTCWLAYYSLMHWINIHLWSLFIRKRRVNCTSRLHLCDLRLTLCGYL